MLGGMNPAKIQGMMKKMGISQEEIPSEQVIIKCVDKNIIIDNPSVTKVIMQGQETFQIAGSVREEETGSEDDDSEDHDDDINTLVEKTGKSKEEAEKALDEANGDLAEAMIALS